MNIPDKYGNFKRFAEVSESRGAEERQHQRGAWQDPSSKPVKYPGFQRSNGSSGSPSLNRCSIYRRTDGFQPVEPDYLLISLCADYRRQDYICNE